MKGIVQKVAIWADHRTGLETTVKNFVFKKHPRVDRMDKVIGSVALVLLTLQSVAGVPLAFSYAPKPGDAHNSLAIIVTALTG